jgi:carbon monoxide dehydrogenase subunit G
MPSLHDEIVIDASPDSVWDAMRDIGALHTRLVPGFVTDTRLESPEVRVVTFFNGMTVREPIVSIDDPLRRIVWTASGEGLPFTHYNGAVQVFAEGGSSRVVWTADFLPAGPASFVATMMEKGLAAMKRALENDSAQAGAGATPP